MIDLGDQQVAHGDRLPQLGFALLDTRDVEQHADDQQLFRIGIADRFPADQQPARRTVRPDSAKILVQVGAHCPGNPLHFGFQSGQVVGMDPLHEWPDGIGVVLLGEAEHGIELRGSRHAPAARAPFEIGKIRAAHGSAPLRLVNAVAQDPAGDVLSRMDDVRDLGRIAAIGEHRRIDDPPVPDPVMSVGPCHIMLAKRHLLRFARLHDAIGRRLQFGFGIRPGIVGIGGEGFEDTLADQLRPFDTEHLAIAAIGSDDVQIGPEHHLCRRLGVEQHAHVDRSIQGQIPLLGDWVRSRRIGTPAAKA